MADMNDARPALRPIREGDLESVIALDLSHSGQSRRGFFEKRWRAMACEPAAFISLAAEWENALVGFVLAHVLDGEFGGSERVFVLDAVGVADDRRGQGIGNHLMQGLVDEVKQRGGREVRTQARWDQRGLLGFFAKAGFRLAPSVVLERSTGEAGW
jgi:GNAT superfamily N-acetyltransferase